MQEWVFYSDDVEKADAQTYLTLWKHFMLKKMNLNLFEEQFHDHQNIWDTGQNTLGIKIKVKERNDSHNTI